MKSVLARIGWMDRYEGTGKIYRGNMQWDDVEEGELWNFTPSKDGSYHGYVMLMARDASGKITGTINIDRLGAQPGDEAVGHVDVIFFAVSPYNNTPYVVGFYRDSIVYRTWREQIGEENKYRRKQHFSFQCKANKAFLIPTRERNIQIITAQAARSSHKTGSFPGQSSIFFQSSNEKYLQEVQGIITKYLRGSNSA